MKVEEGYMPFMGYKTYYRIVGEPRDNQAPLLLMHGGPGSTHNYFEILDKMAVNGRQLIMYDQIGCGHSSMPDDDSLWTKETWVKELQALREYLHLDRVHLLGQSWGGMLGIIYLCDYHPEGVLSMVLASTLPSASLWSQEQHRMIKFLDHDDQVAIAQAEASGNYDEIRYLAANDRYMEQHAAAIPDDSSPEPLRRKKNSGTASYVAGWGPNEYNPLGTLHDYEYVDQLKNIKVPTLITSGTNDLCTPLVAKTMFDQIPNSKWELFAHSRHMAFVEETDKYISVLSHFLAIHE